MGDQQDYGNQVWTKFGYDGRGIISSVRHRQNASGRDLSYREYWRDNRDRIKAWKRGTDRTLNGMEDGRGDRYGYDEEGQLKDADYRVFNPETTPSGALRGLGTRSGWNTVANRGLMFHRRRDNGLNQYFSWENNIPWPNSSHWGTVLYYDDNFGNYNEPPTYTPPWGAPPGNGVTMADGWIVASYNALN